LHYACIQKNLSIFNLILSVTTDIEHKDSNGDSALHWAAMKGSFSIFELLVKKYKILQKIPDPKNNVIILYIL
jgi:ankyrin repeat protein